MAKVVEFEKRTVKPGNNGTFTGEKGENLVPPSDWAFLPAGDAGITRRVTSSGPYWRVEIKKGRRVISLGIWASADLIVQAKEDIRVLRLTDEYKKKLASGIKSREKKQELYGSEFCEAVENFLSFHNQHKELEKFLAKAIVAFAVPVGSGTVARTKMIPIEKRAELAVIAWMRHQTTGYDNLKIARIKGERRAVRRTLAQQSVALLSKYREGKNISIDCPLQLAVSKLRAENINF